MMKQLFFVLIAFAVFTGNAQTGYRQLLISGGLSACNSTIFSIQLEGAGTPKIHAGMMVQTLCYSPYKNLHSPVHNSRQSESAGLYFKKDLYTAKNFCSSAFIGGAVGTDTHDIILYPFGGLEQGWFIRPKTQLFISEELLYLRNIDLANTLQPIFQAGIKCLL